MPFSKKLVQVVGQEKYFSEENVQEMDKKIVIRRNMSEDWIKNAFSKKFIQVVGQENRFSKKNIHGMDKKIVLRRKTSKDEIYKYVDLCRTEHNSILSNELNRKKRNDKIIKTIEAKSVADF